MANWADVIYLVTGDPVQIGSLENILYQLKDADKPIVDNGFGNLWWGCVVKRLGGDYDSMYCRGEIDDIKKDDDGLWLYQSTAWCELSDVRHFLEGVFPDIKVYFFCEEQGCCVYETNDEEGLYFPERYAIIGEDCEYFKDINEVAKYISEIVGMDVAPKDIKDVIDEYNVSIGEDSDECLNFYKVDVI